MASSIGPCQRGVSCQGRRCGVFASGRPGRRQVESGVSSACAERSQDFEGAQALTRCRDHRLTVGGSEPAPTSGSRLAPGITAVGLGSSPSFDARPNPLLCVRPVSEPSTILTRPPGTGLQDVRVPRRRGDVLRGRLQRLPECFDGTELLCRRHRGQADGSRHGTVLQCLFHYARRRSRPQCDDLVRTRQRAGALSHAARFTAPAGSSSRGCVARLSLGRSGPCS
jgi:hypothetical protein